MLPPSLLRLLIHRRIFKVGSAIKGDLTRLRKQFNQLQDKTDFNLIDIKEFAMHHGVLSRSDSGSLDVLAEKLLGSFLSKDESLRCNEGWEEPHLSDALLKYAALDVYASRLVFDAASRLKARQRVTIGSPAGTRVSLCAQEGGPVVAHGFITELQPAQLGSVRVNVRSRSRLVITVDNVILPSAAAALHLTPKVSAIVGQGSRTKSGAMTLQDLQLASGKTVFEMVSPLSNLFLDERDDQVSFSTIMRKQFSLIQLLFPVHSATGYNATDCRTFRQPFSRFFSGRS